LDDDNDMAEMCLTQKLDAGLSYQTSAKEGYNSTSDEDRDERYKHINTGVFGFHMVVIGFWCH